MAVIRKKTYTGCWTCRSRRIKCDLNRPFCQKCIKARLNCEGYSIKLYWNTGETDEEPIFQRRKLEFVKYPPEMTYEFYEDMDKDLMELHSPEFIGQETLKCGPFGVFKCTSNPFNLNGGSVENTFSSYGSVPDSTSPNAAPPNINAFTRILSSDDQFEECLTIDRYCLTQNATFLLNHYINNIVDHMSVSCSDKNPWRTVYLRGALRAISDISVTGKTSNARSALLYSLLAVSACHYSHKQPIKSPVA